MGGSINSFGSINPFERKASIDRRGSLSARRPSLTRRKSIVPKDKDYGWKTVGTPTEIALQVKRIV